MADLAYHLGYKESYLTGQIIGLDGGWMDLSLFGPYQLFMPSIKRERGTSLI